MEILMKDVKKWHKEISPKGYGFLDFALDFANQAHKGQLRKYSSEPYIVHPIAVAKKVAEVFPDIEMIATAYLHDTVEDCGITTDTIANLFGYRVANMVWSLTDISKPGDGNRTKRKELDRKHNLKGSGEALVVKLADLIDNSKSIIEHDPNFAVIYIKEKEKFLNELVDSKKLPKYANPLLDEAIDIILDYYLQKLEEK